MSVTRSVRYAYALLAGAYVLGLVAQVFLIGLYIFNRGDSDAAAAHAGLGWLLHLIPLLILPLAYFARAGRRHWQLALALAAVVFVVPIFATMRDSAALAALHPVSAVVAFVFAVLVAWNSVRALAVRPIGSATS